MVVIIRRPLARCGTGGRLLTLAATPADALRGGVHMATLFEKIIAGELPADFVYRDERVVAFRDIHPQAPVHVLIIPVKPIPTANDIADQDADLVGHMFCVARDIARAEGIADDGYRLIINCNAHGGQEVYHLHLHLLGGRRLGRMLPAP
jgi:histidine triad (HIT) family protein